MSESQKLALSQSVDGKIGQLIDVSIDLDREETKLRETKLQEQIDILNQKVATLTGAITDMELNIQNTTQDDKYALTKAKLIRLMKDLGYYE
tara:strand:- start:1948 stop:2223 length:276 start_codon:yes stop_codon:yes gene_type:complete